MWKQDDEDEELTCPCEICDEKVLVEDTLDCEECGVVVCPTCFEDDICIYCYDDKVEKAKKGG